MFEIKIKLGNSELTEKEADKFVKPRRFFTRAVAEDQAKRLVESEPLLTCDVFESEPNEEEAAEAKVRDAVAGLPVTDSEKEAMIQAARRSRRNAAKEAGAAL